MSWREEILRIYQERPEVSVLILGGGINGMGLLRELALQGVDCLLVDRADFASGATSKSSRMIHGGLRYLEQGDFRLVRESLRERNRLLENAPHTVAPLKTTIPLFSWLGGLLKTPLIFLGAPLRPCGRGAAIVKLGLSFYDLVTRKDRRTPTHFFMSGTRALREIPGLNPQIVAAATYWDASIHQAERLCIELLQDARRENPACHGLNYVGLEGLGTAGGDEGTVKLRDLPTGRIFPVRPRMVVNATGAWVDATNTALGVRTRFMGGTKGSHLVLDKKDLREALGDRMVYYEHNDGRVCIIFGFLDKVIMGSTDIPLEDPDEAACDEAEMAYMLETLQGVFPGVKVAPHEVVFKFCGVRPLPRTGEGIPGKVTRNHRIEVLESGALRPYPVHCLIGGKWTTFRALAEEAAGGILPALGRQRMRSTAHEPIGGGRGFPSSDAQKAQWIQNTAAATGADAGRLSILLGRYGTRAEDCARRAGAGIRRPLESLPDHTAGEIEWIAENDFVVHLTDLVCRRTLIALLGQARRQALEEIAGIAGAVLGWDPVRRAAEVDLALREVAV